MQKHPLQHHVINSSSTLNHFQLSNGIPVAYHLDLAIGIYSTKSCQLLRIPAVSTISNLIIMLKKIESIPNWINRLRQEPFIISLNNDQNNMKTSITDSIFAYLAEWLIQRKLYIISIWITWNSLTRMDSFYNLIKNKCLVDGFFLHLSGNYLVPELVLDFIIKLGEIKFSLIRVDKNIEIAKLLIKKQLLIPYKIVDHMRINSPDQVIQIDDISRIHAQPIINSTLSEWYREIIKVPTIHTINDVNTHNSPILRQRVLGQFIRSVTSQSQRKKELKEMRIQKLNNENC